jgi:hypothetical protein
LSASLDLPHLGLPNFHSPFNPRVAPIALAPER